MVDLVAPPHLCDHGVDRWEEEGPTSDIGVVHMEQRRVDFLDEVLNSLSFAEVLLGEMFDQQGLEELLGSLLCPVRYGETQPWHDGGVQMVA